MKFNVAYDADGGSGAAPISPTQCTYGDANCKAPMNNGYQKNGAVFNGWIYGTTNISVGQNISTLSTGSDDPNTYPTITLKVNWGKCGFGYYCDQSGKHECPIGATTNSDIATLKTECIIKTSGAENGKTKFCQKGTGTAFDVCFYLPDVGNVKYSEN
jgi:hypothetical protein